MNPKDKFGKTPLDLATPELLSEVFFVTIAKANDGTAPLDQKVTKIIEDKEFAVVNGLRGLKKFG